MRLKEKQLNKFARLLGQLDGASALGIARLLGVQLFYEDVKDEKGNPTPRSAESIVEDMVVKFDAASRQDRRTIMGLAAKAAKAKEKTT